MRRRTRRFDADGVGEVTKVDIITVRVFGESIEIGGFIEVDTIIIVNHRRREPLLAEFDGDVGFGEYGRGGVREGWLAVSARRRGGEGFVVWWDLIVTFSV